MRSDVARDLDDGAHDFMRVVWPAIRHKMQKGQLKPVEAVASDELQRDLDQLAGIDAWHVLSDEGLMRGIASRIQWLGPGEDPYRSFTIRMRRPNGSRTEFEKRCEALDRIQEGWLLPHLTVHAYIAKPRRVGQLLTAAVVRTKDLYQYARDRPTRKWRRNPEDGVEFTPWWWDELTRAKVQVAVVDSRPDEPHRTADAGSQLDADNADPWYGIEIAKPGSGDRLGGRLREFVAQGGRLPHDDRREV